MSTVPYKIAHQVLPIRAGQDPVNLWNALSGPEWSTWLALVGQILGEPVRKIGVEGVVTDAAVKVREGVEMLAMYFPDPAGPGEPYFAVLARRVGATELRSFVFEKGIPEAGAPVRVVMAEWRIRGENTMRLRYDVETDPSLEACLRRSASVFNEEEASQPAPNLPPPSTLVAPKRRRGDGSSPAGIAVAIFAVVFVIAMAWYFFFVNP